MSNSRKKQAKKKARERQGKARVLRRRVEKRKVDKEDRLQREAEEKARKAEAKFERSTTIRNKDLINPEENDEKVLQQLEHNLEILKALEKEYDDEREEKRRLNAELEATGAVTPAEKAEAIKVGAVEKMYKKMKGKSVGGIAGGAECKIILPDEDETET